MAAAEAPAGPAPSDETVREELAVLLKGADLAVTTEKMLRKQLEEKLGCDLTDRKQLIREQVSAYLEQLQDDEGQGAEEEESEPASAPSSRKKAKGEGGGGRRGGGGLGSVLSPEMQAFLGVESMPRPQVVKAIWEYIRANNLQDPKNKRNIICDEKMKTIFTPPINMFNMNKQLSKHCKTGKDASRSGGSGSGGGNKRKKGSNDDEDNEDEDSDEGAGKRKKGKSGGGGGGFTAPVQVSEALGEFLGVKEGESINRPQITKRMWEYFRGNNLLDPSDKRRVLCDERLKALAGVDSFQAFGMMKYLKTHINPGKAEAGGRCAAKKKEESEEEDREQEEEEEEDES